MIMGVRAGQSLREVAAQYGVSAPTVRRWVERASGKRLDRADFSDQPDVPHKVANRTSAEIERQALSVLGHQFEVAKHWIHRLVRCVVDIDAKVIRFYSLRRREPQQQPLLQEVFYSLPPRYVGD